MGGFDVWDVLPDRHHVRCGRGRADHPRAWRPPRRRLHRPRQTPSTPPSRARTTSACCGSPGSCPATCPATRSARVSRSASSTTCVIPQPAGVSTVYTDTAHVRSYLQPTNVTGRVEPRCSRRRTSTPRCPPRPADRTGGPRRLLGEGALTAGGQDRDHRDHRAEQQHPQPGDRRRGASPTATRWSCPAQTEVYSGHAVRQPARRHRAARRPPATLPSTRTPHSPAPRAAGRGRARPGHRRRCASGRSTPTTPTPTSASRSSVTARVTTAAITAGPERGHPHEHSPLREPRRRPAATRCCRSPPATAQPAPATPDAHQDERPGAAPVPGGTLVTVHPDAAQRQHERHRHQPPAAARHVPRRLRPGRPDLRGLRRRTPAAPPSPAPAATAAPPARPGWSGRSATSPPAHRGAHLHGAAAARRRRRRLLHEHRPADRQLARRRQDRPARRRQPARAHLLRDGVRDGRRWPVRCWPRR